MNELLGYAQFSFFKSMMYCLIDLKGQTKNEIWIFQDQCQQYTDTVEPR